MRRPITILIAAGMAFTSFAATASAQDLSGLLDRLGRLEQDLNALQRKVYRGETGSEASSGASAPAAVSSEPLPASVAGRLEVRMTKIEAELRQLTGRVEEVDHKISTVTGRLDKLVADIDFRLSELEGGRVTSQPAGDGFSGSADQTSGLPETASGPQTLGTLTQDQIDAGASVQPFTQEVKLPDGTPEEQYAFAFDLLKRKEYDNAASAFGSFVETNKDHKLAGNAQYWLGETYYVRQDYERAAIAFAQGFKNYNSSPKAPDNMLKLGMSLAQIGQTDQACTAFRKLADSYPDASATIRQRAATERRRNNCN